MRRLSKPAITPPMPLSQHAEQRTLTATSLPADGKINENMRSHTRSVSVRAAQFECDSPQLSHEVSWLVFCMVLTEDDAHISSWHSNSVRARISRDVRIVSESRVRSEPSPDVDRTRSAKILIIPN